MAVSITLPRGANYEITEFTAMRQNQAEKSKIQNQKSDGWQEKADARGKDTPRGDA
jgi:hypothetical protein